jgi:hypothetical protein
VYGRSQNIEKKDKCPKEKVPTNVNNEELRENRKNQYFEGKRKYQAANRKEKINSWKQHIFKQPVECSVQAGLGKTRNTAALTTVKKPDGSKKQT